MKIMKKYLRKFVIFFVIFVIFWQYFPLVIFKPGFENVIYVALVFTILDTFLKPILKKIMFPINVITFGLASLVMYALIFYAGEKLSKGIITVTEYTIPLLKTDLGLFGPYPINYPYTYVVSGLCVVILNRFLSWVFKKDEH